MFRCYFYEIFRKKTKIEFEIEKLISFLNSIEATF